MTDSTPVVPPAELRALLERWVPAQRWYQGKGRSATFHATELAVLSDTPPPVSIWTVRVDYGPGAVPETYQVPLTLRTEPVATLEHVLLGSVNVDGTPYWVYDALHDKEVTQAWLEGVRDQRNGAVLHFARTADPEAVPVGQQSLVLSAEQSNTSLVYGDKAILKVFRRLEKGINPDIEVHDALAGLGSTHVAALLGSVSAEIDGHEASLAMLQEFLTTGTDGWELAKASVRDLLAEADLHADEVGGDFAGESERLGAAIASVHTDLATVFGTGVLSAETLEARGHAMLARLDSALKAVPDLAPYEDGLREVFTAFLEDTSPLPTQRVHGDLHLGQVMRTVRRWVVLDFEGEPLNSMAARRAFDSPLRDIAGMLRSFDYAARHQIADGTYSLQREFRSDEWAQRNRSAFCDGYAAQAGADPREHHVRLRAFEADKAVYEAIYEARQRPGWLGIPLSSLAKLSKLVPTEGSS